MSTAAQTIVQRLWNYCNLLRDDGMSYGDYVEQLTYLLFLKMAYERTQPPYNQLSRIPQGYGWESLMSRDGDALETHYRHLLEELGKQPGMLGIIFRKAQNKIQDPAKLRRLIVDLINRETWTILETDVKGDAYEGLLQKNAEDTKSGAGQYFTPRPLIKAMVDVTRPEAGQRICDPACGTGGFLLASHDYIMHHYNLDRDQKRFLKYNALHGWEIVDNTARLCVMNLFLHGISSDENGKSPIRVADSLRSHPGEYFDIVLTNPPFGRKSSVTFVNEEGDEEREATVVVPDNVLFEGGAGETIRRKLLQECEVHTLLRLPTGIFYAQGVKANVLFFDKRPASPNHWTERLWVYDLRTNQNFTLRTNPLTRAHLDDFVASYHPENRHQRQESERFRSFSYDELLKRDKVSLDLFWLRDESLESADMLASPDVLAASIVEDLQAALEQFMAIVEDLGGSGAGGGK